jgi:hypothetical protein
MQTLPQTLFVQSQLEGDIVYLGIHIRPHMLYSTAADTHEGRMRLGLLLI